MGKKAEPQNNTTPLPRRYVSVDTLLILFSELKDKLGSIPSQVINGNIMYDVLAAADIVNRSRPQVSDRDDLPEDDTIFSDNGDTQ